MEIPLIGDCDNGKVESCPTLKLPCGLRVRGSMNRPLEMDRICFHERIIYMRSFAV